MSALTPLLPRGLTGSALWLLVSAPTSTRAMECVLALTSFFLCFFVPSGWVLSHLENYKKRE